MKNIIVYLIIGLVGLYSCKDKNSKEQLSRKAPTIVQEWFANANYAGEIVALEKFDHQYDIDLSIIEGSYEIDPIKMVLSNEAEIGVAGADKVLVANDKGAELVIIGVINPISPTCFLSLKEHNVKSPSDWQSLKIGVLSGTATEYVYRALLHKFNFDGSKLNEIEVSFDLNSFINKQYDVRPAFIYDETVSLDNQNISYDIIKPNEFGVNFLGTVYFCKRKYLEENPKVVKKVIYSLIEGWEYALENQSETINLLKNNFPSIDTEREKASLSKAEPYFVGDDDMHLFADSERWDGMVETLKRLEVISKFDSNDINYSFVKDYYRK